LIYKQRLKIFDITLCIGILQSSEINRIKQFLAHGFLRCDYFQVIHRFAQTRFLLYFSGRFNRVLWFYWLFGALVWAGRHAPGNLISLVHNLEQIWIILRLLVGIFSLKPAVRCPQKVVGWSFRLFFAHEFWALAPSCQFKTLFWDQKLDVGNYVPRW